MKFLEFSGIRRNAVIKKKHFSLCRLCTECLGNSWNAGFHWMSMTYLYVTSNVRRQSVRELPRYLPNCRHFAKCLGSSRIHWICQGISGQEALGIRPYWFQVTPNRVMSIVYFALCQRTSFNPRPGMGFRITRPGRGVESAPLPTYLIWRLESPIFMEGGLAKYLYGVQFWWP